MRRFYAGKRFGADARSIISVANAICEEYQAVGLDLTLRQLYYQFVARGYIANKQSEYKRLGDIVNKARMAGELDWDYIVDRTRNLEKPSTWESPQSIVDVVVRQYATDLWASQETRVEVWIEKDALTGVIEGICDELQVPYFSCRGYTSQSEMWSAGMRLTGYIRKGQQPVILHLGDHDPSGLDMTRDIRDRLRQFVAYNWIYDQMPDRVNGDPVTLGQIQEHMSEAAEREIQLPIIKRIALNWDQIEEYDPPPNPAKLTDSRASEYVGEHGYESWELDALEPTVLVDLIRDEVEDLRVDEWWDEAVERQEAHRELLSQARDWLVEAAS